MPYTLYTDKPENFVCEVAVKNASTKDAFVRMIVESDNVALVFKGEIKDGKCNVPIRRLKGLLDETSKGKMHLEIVVEDTYFKPWEDDFIVEQHTSVKVQVQEQKKPSNPIVEVKVPSTTQKKGINIWVPFYELSKICERFDIKKANLSVKRNDLQQLVQEYFNANPEFKPHKLTIVKGLKHFLK